MANHVVGRLIFCCW